MMASDLDEQVWISAVLVGAKALFVLDMASVCA